MTSRWEEVLDQQLALHNWLTGRHGQMFGAGYFESAYTSPLPGEGNPEWTSIEDARSAGARWARGLGVATFNAEPIYIDPDMMTVVEAAVDGFRPEPLAETDLITPNGFLLMPRSLWLLDPSGNRLSWRAAVWAPVANGISLTLLHDVFDPDDMDARHGGFNDYISSLGMKWTSPFIPTHVVKWDFGAMHPGMTGSHDVKWSHDGFVIEPTAEETSATAHRQVQGLWRLLVQHLAAPTKQRPPRQAVKRARAAKLPNEHVTVVYLRRPPQETEKADMPVLVNWTHRWVVGGHWRNQWYPSESIHRQIWISPFVKGPEELPLVVNKARIFRLVR